MCVREREREKERERGAHDLGGRLITCECMFVAGGRRAAAASAADSAGEDVTPLSNLSPEP